MAKIIAIKWHGSDLTTALIMFAVLAGLWPLAEFLVREGGNFRIGSYELNIAVFTVMQAGLSTILSVVPALLIARSLAKRDFAARKFLLVLCNLPLSIPPLVAVLSFVGLFGQSGIFPSFINLYGLTGIIILHVFFNLPMAVRLFFNVLHEAEIGHHLLGQNLGFSVWQKFRHIEWPLLQSAFPQVAGLIFLLCASSFVVVLTLGGVSATTLEVAIYQALRLDFDPARAATLALLHLIICVTLVSLAHKAFIFNSRTNSKAVLLQEDLSLFDLILIACLVVIIVPALLVLVFAGFSHIHFSSIVFRATATSLGLGLISAILSFGIAWSLARRASSLMHIISLTGLIISPAILGMGWFLFAMKIGLSDIYLIVFIIFLNVFAALPFTYAALRSGFVRKLQPLQRLQTQLGIASRAGFWVVEWPLLKIYARQAFFMGLVLSLGDLTAITLMGRGNLMTLPTLLQSEMSHYRGDDAQGTALLLLTLCILMAIFSHKNEVSDA